MKGDKQPLFSFGKRAAAGFSSFEQWDARSVSSWYRDTIRINICFVQWNTLLAPSLSRRVKKRGCYGSRMITVFGFPGRRFPSLSRRVKKRGCYGNRMITVSGFFGYSVSLTTGPDGNFALRLSQTAPAYMLYRRCALFGRRYYAVSAVCADCHLKRILF